MTLASQSVVCRTDESVTRTVVDGRGGCWWWIGSENEYIEPKLGAARGRAKKEGKGGTEVKAKRVVRPAGGGGASRDSTEYFFSLKKKGRTGSKQIVFFSNKKLAKIQGVHQILCFFENFEIYSGLWPLSVFKRCVYGPLNGRYRMFFTIHCNPSLAYIAIRGLQSSQRNASVQSLLLADICVQPLAAQ